MLAWLLLQVMQTQIAAKEPCYHHGLEPSTQLVNEQVVVLTQDLVGCLTVTAGATWCVATKETCSELADLRL